MVQEDAGRFLERVWKGRARVLIRLRSRLDEVCTRCVMLNAVNGACFEIPPWARG